MLIFETINCPRCHDGEIRFVVENNKAVSHGNCNKCDRHLSAEQIQFQLDCNQTEEAYAQLDENWDLDLCSSCGKFYPMFIDSDYTTVCVSCIYAGIIEQEVDAFNDLVFKLFEHKLSQFPITIH
jgi:hypothetical protein